MNKYLKEKMHEEFDKNEYREYDTFKEGFKSACDFLIPIIKKCSPHIHSQAVANHLLDGFSVKKHDLDDFYNEIRRIIE